MSLKPEYRNEQLHLAVPPGHNQESSQVNDTIEDLKPHPNSNSSHEVAVVDGGGGRSRSSGSGSSGSIT